MLVFREVLLEEPMKCLDLISVYHMVIYIYYRIFEMCLYFLSTLVIAPLGAALQLHKMFP